MTTAPQPILAVGDLVWDVLVKPDTVLLPGGDTTGRIELAPGGSAANTAAWIARCGSPAGFVGMVGADVFGDLIVRDLEHEGVVMHVPRTHSRGTGVILALVDQTGQRSMVTNQGADFALMPADLPVAALQAARHVHLTAWSLFTDPPREAALIAARIAQQAGVPLSLDPASYQMIREQGVTDFRGMFADLQIDMLFPNDDEARILTGEQKPEHIALALAEQFPGTTIVLKLGQNGCYALADGQGCHYPTSPVDAVDTTGAGDAFDAAFLACWYQTGDLGRAAQYANRIAGWVVARYGARPARDPELAALL